MRLLRRILRHRQLLPDLDLGLHEASAQVPVRPKGKPDAWAREVLSVWGIGADDAVVIRRFDARRVIRATAPDGRDVVLRTYPAPSNSRVARSFGRESLEQLVAWAAALDRETSLDVPAPVPSPAGDFVAPVRPDPLSPPGPWQEEPGSAILLSWVEGEIVPPADMDSCTTAATGRLLGEMHNHAATWVPPEEWVRPAWGPSTFRRSARIWRYSGSIVPGTPELLTQLNKALRRRTADLQAHTTAHGDAHQGVIHRDLSPENVVHRDGEAYPIDLDGCGTGPFLYDLALPLLRLASRPDAATLHDNVVHAYDEVRPLPPGATRLLRLQVAVRLVDRLESLLRHKDAYGQLDGPRHARAVETARALHEVCAAAGVRPR